MISHQSLLIAASLAMAGLLSCSRQPPAESTGPKGYNVVLINIDTLRADHLGCYGYSRPTSPFMDRLAREGVVFTRAMANSSYTRESVAVLFSGQLPSHSGSIGWEARPADGTAHLAELFQAAGYLTAFFSNTTMLTDPQFTKGFHDVQHLTTTWGLSGAGGKLSARAIEFVKAAPTQPFMMYLHYLDPHGPYEPPPDLYLRFTPNIFPNPVNVYTDVRPNCAALMRQGFGPGEARFEDMVLRYDAEIADTDRAIETLVEGLDALHVLQRTLVVISADHGEEFLEHGFVEHAWTLYNESLHVPLILWAPGVLQPQRIDGRVSVVDVLPTLLELTEIPHDQHAFDGTSLAERHDAALTFRAPQTPVITELLITQRNVLRTVMDGEWSYIAAQRWLTAEERPAAITLQDQQRGVAAAVDTFGPITHEELYNVMQDPQEKRDLLSAFPREHQRLRNTLQAYTTRCRDALPQPPTRPTLAPENVERLRALGYLSDAP